MKIYFSNYLIVVSLLFPLTTQYQQYNIEDDDLCSLIKKRIISLQVAQRSGLIIKQSRLNDHVIQWSSNFKCKFRLVATSDQGIIAVIQHLVFRKNATTNECIDYVQFTRKNHTQSPKFCGRFNAALHMDHTFVGQNHRVTSNAFVDDRGEIDTTIFVSKEALRPDEEMDLSIVYTAYTKCGAVTQREFQTVPCSLPRKDYCIYEEFFGDFYFNCPEPDCQDESGCSTYKELNKFDPSIGNKVLIGSLSLVTILFAVFIITLWLLRTYKLLCWSEQFSNPSHTPPAQSEQTRVIELNERTAPVPSAPQVSIASPSTEEDKDLPPSYDSLFPSR